MKGYQSRNDPKMVPSAIYTNPNMTSNQQEQIESFRNMKKIWKKAVFSIKKESKHKSSPHPEPIPPLPSSSFDLNDPAALGTEHNTHSSQPTTEKLSVDPIYLMLKSGPSTSKKEDKTLQHHKNDDHLSISTNISTSGSNQNLSPMIGVDSRKLSPHMDSGVSGGGSISRIKESNSASRLTVGTGNPHRRRLDHRMKSQSIDNSEPASGADYQHHNQPTNSNYNHQSYYPTSPAQIFTKGGSTSGQYRQSDNNQSYSSVNLHAQSKQLSNSFTTSSYMMMMTDSATHSSSSGIYSNSTNNTLSSSSNNASSRRKYMMEHHHRSISMEHEPVTNSNTNNPGMYEYSGHSNIHGNYSNHAISNNTPNTTITSGLGSASNYNRSSSSITSPRQSTRYIATSGTSDDSKYASQSSMGGGSVSTGNPTSGTSKMNFRSSRGNWKMKSFSVDIPDGDQEHISPTCSQHFNKANSHTSSPIRERPRISSNQENQSNQAYQYSPSMHTNPAFPYSNAQHQLSSHQHSSQKHHQQLPSQQQQHHQYTYQNVWRRSYTNLVNSTAKSAQSSQRSSRSAYGSIGGGTKYCSNTNIAPNTDSANYEYQMESSSSRRQSSYVVIQDFYARRSDEIDLKAGWRIDLLKCSDPEWWTGRCSNGRVGYFPAACVQKIPVGDTAWKMMRDIELEDEDGNCFNLKKGEIVVQQGQQNGENLPICIKRTSYLWCPIDYMGKIFDDYI